MIFWPGGTIRSDLYKSLRLADFHLHLFSFYHERNRRLDMAEDKLLDFRLFADSGAFSAWTKGDEVDLDEYCAFLQYHIGYLEAYAALDVIPSSTHPDDLEKAAERSWWNYQYMLDIGLAPIPIYHYGEQRPWLNRMLDGGCRYIGLGGMGNANKEQRIAWLDSVFDYLDGSDVQVHGFGVSAINLVFRYPWYSTDSTTWLHSSSTGKVFIPHHNSEDFLFNCAPYLVHTQELLSTDDRAIDRWLDIVGTDRQGLHTDYVQRRVCNAVFMREVTAHRLEHGHKKRTSTQERFFQ